MSPPSMPIRVVGGSSKAQLKLEGTVLVCTQKRWSGESTLLIPVESVTMSEHPRFHKELTKYACWIPVVMIFFVLAIYLLLRSEGPNREELIVFISTAILVTVLLETWLLLGYLMSFLFTKNSICLILPNGNAVIEFWKTKKVARLIVGFEEVVEEMRTRVQESMTGPSTEIFEIREVNHLYNLIVSSFLFCLPAAALHAPALLVLGLVPTGWHTFKKIRLMKHPKEYREAVRAYKRKDWNRAILHLESLLEQTPKYTAATLFLMDAYMRAGRFDDALQVAGTVPDNYLEDSNALYLGIWKWKRVHLRRRETEQ